MGGILSLSDSFLAGLCRYSVKFDTSINKYSALVETLPELLANVLEGDIPPSLVESTREKASAYDEVYCEFGSGSGGHILALAEANPDKFYVGFELRFKRAYRTAEKALKQGLKNLFILRADGRLANQLFPPESLSGVYVNFPDPWARKRWKKHRILNSEFFSQVHRWLKEDGFFSHKSDHQSYFRDTTELLADSFVSKGLFSIQFQTDDLHASEMVDQSVPTEFEMLFKSKGLPIYFIEIRKCLEAD
jgi:tRNA (guanine-N7-)-methyltransferase